MTQRQVLTHIPARTAIGLAAKAASCEMTPTGYGRQALRCAAGMPSVMDRHDLDSLNRDDAQPLCRLDSVMNFRLSPEEISAIGDRAEIRGWTRSEWIRAVLAKVAG